MLLDGVLSNISLPADSSCVLRVLWQVFVIRRRQEGTFHDQRETIVKGPCSVFRGAQLPNSTLKQCSRGLRGLPIIFVGHERLGNTWT